MLFQWMLQQPEFVYRYFVCVNRYFVCVNKEITKEDVAASQRTLDWTREAIKAASHRRGCERRRLGLILLSSPG